VKRKYYIIAGEASGDMYGSSLVESMLKIDPNLRFKGFGGEKMKKSGVDISIGIDKLAVMGFLEVLLNIMRILSYFRKAKSEILEFQPDALILIDYPGFNLRLAEWAKKRGLKVYYYIAPMVWAWGKKRIPKIKAYTDKLFVILPFEEEFFKNHGIDAVYVGNPLLEEISKFRSDPAFSDKYSIPSESVKVAFFPGSRLAELKNNIDPVLSVIEKSKDKIFLVAARSELKSKIQPRLSHLDNVRIIYDQNYDILNVADAGIIKSGTASLEAVIFKVPHFVIYKTSYISNLIIKKLVTNIKFASLINLILDKEVVTELLQEQIYPKNVDKELSRVLTPSIRDLMINDFEKCKFSIKIEKNPSELVAEYIVGNTGLKL
jgi:lipid-A-disaccharide synthase